MAEVHSLKKDEKNNHGSYNYVSVDKFKDFVRPLMAKHGLSISMSEVAYALEPIQGKNGTTMHARITYEFLLCHESGAQDRPECTTITLPLTGAQTAGAAKSYAIKEYLKGRFLVSTGDKDYIEGGVDADAYKQQDYTTPANDTSMPAVTGTPGSSKAASRDVYTALVKDIRNAATVTALKAWYQANVTTIDGLPPDFLDELRVEYNDRLSELKGSLAA